MTSSPGSELSFVYDLELEQQIRKIEEEAEARTLLATRPCHNSVEVKYEEQIGQTGLDSPLRTPAPIKNVADGITSTAPTETGGATEPEMTRLTLFQRFRKRQYFNVTDLVAPLWCEFQYDYRLRSKPNLRPEDRPDVIVSRQGKEIPVDKSQLKVNDKVMKRGQVSFRYPAKTESQTWTHQLLHFRPSTRNSRGRFILSK